MWRPLSSASVAPLARWIKARTVAVLLPSLTPPAFGFAAFLGALAACLAEVAFLGLAAAAALGLPPLALFWPLGAPFLGLAPFFGEAFSGATFAPCAATAAAVSVLVLGVSALWLFIFVSFPSAVITAVTTWITPKRLKSKVVVQQIDDGEGLAM